MAMTLNREPPKFAMNIHMSRRSPEAISSWSNIVRQATGPFVCGRENVTTKDGTAAGAGRAGGGGGAIDTSLAKYCREPK